MDSRTPPYSEEAERALIASALLDREVVHEAEVRTEDFYRAAHQSIWTAIRVLASNEDGVDIVTVSEYLASKGDLEKAGGNGYLMGLMDATPTSANARLYAGIVAEKAIRRQIQRVCMETLRDIETAEIDELVEALGVEIRHGGGGIQSLREILPETFSTIERRYDRRESIAGITSGFVDIDQLMDGWMPYYYVLAARPSMGKSALAWAWAQGAAEAGHMPFIVNVEMDNHSMLVRALADLADVDIWRLQKGALRREDWPALIEAQSRLMSLNVLFDETVSRVGEVERSIRQAKRKGADIIFVDYLQLISGGKGHKREREVAEISMAMKRLSKQLKIPIIALAQLSRAVDNREEKRPVLADLRESGQIEQDADVVMFLYREFYYTHRQEVENKAELIIRKGRHVGTGTIPLYFEEKKTRFRNWRKDGQI